MGLRDRHGAAAAAASHRYQMRGKLLAIGDDFWIEDESGRRAYKVDGKAARVRDTFVLRDADGNAAGQTGVRCILREPVMHNTPSHR